MDATIDTEKLNGSKCAAKKNEAKKEGGGRKPDAFRCFLYHAACWLRRKKQNPNLPKQNK